MDREVVALHCDASLDRTQIPWSENGAFIFKVTECACCGFRASMVGSEPPASFLGKRACSWSSWHWTGPQLLLLPQPSLCAWTLIMAIILRMSDLLACGKLRFVALKTCLNSPSESLSLRLNNFFFNGSAR